MTWPAKLGQHRKNGDGNTVDDRLGKTISNIVSWKDLDQLEANIRAKGRLTDEVRSALAARSTSLGAEYIFKETALVPAELSNAERKIVIAIGEYAAIMKRQGKAPNYTLKQIRNRGLIDAVEASVCKAKPTQGYEALSDADLEDLSYESIVLDHPDEFSARAMWFSRRTLGLPNVSNKPPAQTHGDVSTRTDNLLAWLKQRAGQNDGLIPLFSNAEAAAAIGLGALKAFGRVHGNIQSRIDFACYLADLPPLGCAAIAPFEKAWSQEDREWLYPVAQLQRAAQTHVWQPDDFDRIAAAANQLPGIAHLPWRDALRNAERNVRAWVNRWAKPPHEGGNAPDERHLHRLPAETLAKATPEHIWAAIQRFTAGDVEHGFGPSTDFDLVVEECRFRPKAVFGVALSMALNGQIIEPKHFSGGEGSVCFRLLRYAGYVIVPKGQEVMTEPNAVLDQEWREGDQKLVPHWRKERAAGVAKAKKAQFRRLNGRLFCERCKIDPVDEYGTTLAESCIEVHHNSTHVSAMNPGHITTLDDLQCLCANCHRLVHRLVISHQSAD
jgi:hypothetical protein